MARLHEKVAVITGGSSGTGLRPPDDLPTEMPECLSRDVVARAAGKVDVLMLNAAFVESVPLGQITEEHDDATFNTNVRAVIFGLQRVLPILSDNASVIVTGSIAASRGSANMSVYAGTA